MNDLKFALRQLTRHKGASLLAILVLGLGIGLVVMQFSFVNGVMLKGLPFTNSEQLHVITRLKPGQPGWAPSGRREFAFLREHQTSFTDLAAFAHQRLALSGPGAEPQYYLGAALTANTLPLLGAQPQLGRAFAEGEDQPGAAPLVLLSHRIWQRDFGSDSSVVGRAVKLNGETATVIGVMPAGFAFPVIEDVWTNLRVGDSAPPSESAVEVFGRLRAEVRLEAAQNEFNALAARLAETHPDTNDGHTQARLQSYLEFYNGPEAAPMLWTMLAMVVGVLLIACSNVANLLLARAVRRVRELAVRNALGASRAHTLRLLLGESLVLATLGAALGLGIAKLGTTLLARQLELTRAPFWFDVSLDWRAVLVVIACAAVAGIVAGLFPALQAARINLNDQLKDSSRGASSFHLGRFSKLLVTAQIALSCCLLVVTGLMARSVALAHSAETMPHLDAMLSARLELLPESFPTPADRAQFFTTTAERLAALPGAPQVAWTSRHPGDSTMIERTEIVGRNYARREEMPLVHYEIISPDYFATVGVPVLKGRPFTTSDGVQGSAVCLVNQALADKHWPGEDPVGKQVHPRREGSDWLATTGPLTVMGVVPDLGLTGRSPNPDKSGIYVPLRLADPRTLTLLVRTDRDPAALAPTVRQVIKDVAPDQPVLALQTVRQGMRDQVRVRRMISTMFVIFGGAAILLACAGIYGVSSFALQQRTREFGIRIALGARPRTLTTLLLRQSAGQLGGGVLGGLLLAFALSQPLRAMLFQVSTSDPLVYGGVLIAVLTAALLAMSPAIFRSTRIAPVEALRAE